MQILVLVLLAGLMPPAPVTLTGTVLDPGGKPVERAWVSVASLEISVYTDSEGRFVLEVSELPLDIEVIHPSYQTTRLQIRTADSIEIRLQRRRQLDQEITVTARVPSSPGFSPVGASATMVQPADSPTPSSTLTELVETVPGMAENGQGGLFQVYSIRGVSRQRVLTTIGGARLTSERRAGVSASFLDPLLMDSIDILRGPSSSYYGSGALGGVVQILPQTFQDWIFEAGYETQGDEKYLMGGWGNGNWSAGFVRRDAGNARTPDGTDLNSHFTQYSAVFARRWEPGKYTAEVSIIPSLGRDIGKSSTDFPDQQTNYPEEKHLLVQFSMQAPQLWQLRAFVHPHDLQTRDLESSVEANVFNDTFDYGASFSRQIRWSGNRSSALGIEYFGRRGVDALERRFNLNSQSEQEIRSLYQGEEDELGAYGTVKLQLGKVDLEGGGRLSWFRQQNAGATSVDQTAWNGFLGARLPLGRGFELNGGLGSGLRFASLSERYFSGTTGRGQVVGNPSLDSERSVNLESGLRWYGRKVFAAVYAFHNTIDDYIERIETEPDVLTFRNLTQGTIRGLEFETVFRPKEALELHWRGHWMRGTDLSGDSLADIPASRYSIGGRYRTDRWSWGATFQHRFDKIRPGSGEKSIPSAELLSGFLDYQVNACWTVSLSATNLLNQEFFNSADRMVPLAPGRSLAAGIRWQPSW